MIIDTEFLTVESFSYVRADSRQEAIEKLILSNPLLALLYDAGPNRDGRGGWVNVIKDQVGSTYRLLFYVHKFPVADEFSSRESYEVLFGAIDQGAEPSYPRAVYTTTGAVNLMSDGIPNERFVRLLSSGALRLVPYPSGRSMKVQDLRSHGYAYIMLFEEGGEGVRILDLSDYDEVVSTRRVDEICVRNDAIRYVGDTRFVRPMLIRFQAHALKETSTASQAAERELGRMSELQATWAEAAGM